MSTHKTEHLQLNLPQPGDLVRVTELNENSNILDDAIYNKQDKLTAGNNVTIENNVISSTGNTQDVYVNGQSVLDPQHIAQIKSYKIVTQAQYDALPASKLTDGVMYCISDAGSTMGQIILNGVRYTSTDVSVTPLLDTGVQIATISVGSDTFDLYAPAGGGGSDIRQMSIINRTSSTSTVTATGEVTS